MKLLIITQRVDENDAILGFFCGWIEEFAKNADKVLVITQSAGSYNLPENVDIFSLGKEKGFSKVRQLLNFYKLLFKNIVKVDAVLVHMVPMWVVFGSPVFKIFRKKTYLWYVHKKVNLMFRLDEKFVEKIFTASLESCRLKSKKILIVGHGIDVNRFPIPNFRLSRRVQNNKYKILTAGRIAPAKNLHILLDVADILKNKNFNFEIKIAGAPVMEEDKPYFEELKNTIKERKLENNVFFAGAIPYKKLAGFLREGDLFVNLSNTGSIDKAVLDAMISDLLVLVSNEAFFNVLPEKYLTDKNPDVIAEKIIALSKVESDPSLRDYVIKNYSLSALVRRLLGFMASKTQ